MSADVLRITDGDSHCRLSDPASGPVQVPLAEIGLQGALLKTQIQLETNAYIDITLALKDLAPRQLFAHVVSAGAEGLRLRWLHFDPGEETKLKSLLESYSRHQGGGKTPAAGAKVLGDGTGGASHSSRRVVKPSGDAPAASADAPAPHAGGTRRLVRPSATAITPFSDVPPMPAAPASGESARVGTRRVVRPSQQALTPFADVAAKPASEPTPAIGEESRTQQVVIEPTDRFEKLVDVGVAMQGKPAPSPRPATTENKGESGTTSGAHSISGGHPTTGETPFGEDSGAHPTTGGKTTVIGKDGRMDIGASIRTHAKTVRASELAARHDRVRVLNMATIKALIQEAVEEAASHLTRALGEAERKRLLEEAEEGFQDRLKAFEAEKLSSDVRAKRLNEQLESAQRLLADERKRTIKADQFTVSSEGLGEIEERFQRLLNRSLAEGGVPPALEEELRKLIAHILDSERDKIRERELGAQNAKIELLERKIGRLAGTLEESERQRDEAQRFAAFLESQGGGSLRNVFTAGIKGEDPNKEKKLALMKKILDENRALRQSLGIELSKVEESAAAAPAAAAPPASVPQEMVEPEPEAEPVAEEPAPEAGEEVVAEINPDDEPWEVKPLANIDEGVNQSGIKRMDVKAALAKGAPPLERK